VEIDAALAAELAVPLRLLVNAQIATGNPVSADVTAFVVAVERLAAQPPPVDLSPLTRREREVAALIADGYKDAEIAGRLFISARTVESHILSARLKLGLPNRAALAAQVRTSPDVPEMGDPVGLIA
jgi:DNA-binding NarL/FixJ family response regulator